MNIRVVTSLPEFDRLAPLWERLVRDGRLSSPFVTHDWFACCWRTVGPNRQRQLVVLEDTDGPVAMMPLVRWRTSLNGLPVTVVSLMDGPGHPVAEFPVARRRQEVTEQLLAIFAKRRDWDVLVVPGLIGSSAAANALVDALSERPLWSVAAQDIIPQVIVSGRWQQYLQERTRWLVPILAAGAQLERTGALQVEQHAHLSPDTTLFNEVMELAPESGASPQAMVNTPPEICRFYRAICQRASANDWLRLWVLRHEGRVTAAELHLQHGAAVYVLRTAHDPATRFAPFLRASILRSFFEGNGNKVHRYELGSGDDEALLRWSTAVRETMTIRVYAATNYGRLLHNIQTRLVPLARRYCAQLRRTAG
jgi:hypothetical protein